MKVLMKVLMSAVQRTCWLVVTIAIFTLSGAV